MLRRWSSQTPLSGALIEQECPRCHEPVQLPLGELCGECRGDIDRRAGRLGRLIAAISTALVAIYVVVRMPPDPTARMVGAGSIAIWYLLTFLVAKRVLREYLK